jgi:hypothetical protein
MLAFLGVILLAVGKTAACLCGHGIVRVRSGTESHWTLVGWRTTRIARVCIHFYFVLVEDPVYSLSSFIGGKFPSVVWRVSWSLAGNILAVSCADGKVSLWKENLKGVWECVSEMDS